MRLKVPVRVQVYEKHVGLVDGDGHTIGTVADRGGLVETARFGKTLCRRINRRGADAK